MPADEPGLFVGSILDRGEHLPSPERFATLRWRFGQSRPWGVGTPSTRCLVELLGRVADAHVQGSA